MEIVGAESDFTGDIARTWFGREGREFDVMPPAIQRQVLKLQLVELGIAADFDLIESLRRSANQPMTVFANLSVSRDEKGNVNLHERHAPGFSAHELTVQERHESVTCRRPGASRIV